MMTDDEIIAVVQAHKEGKKIQGRCARLSNIWVNLESEIIAWDFIDKQYRVAPEPRKPREWIIRLDPYGNHAGFIIPVHPSPYPSKDEEVRVREVI